MTLNYPMVGLKSRSFGERGEKLYCHYSQVHPDPWRFKTYQVQKELVDHFNWTQKYNLCVVAPERVPNEIVNMDIR